MWHAELAGGQTAIMQPVLVRLEPLGSGTEAPSVPALDAQAFAALQSACREN